MKKTLILVLIGITFFSCSSDDENGNQNNCDFPTLINKIQYATAPSDPLEIYSLEIKDNCLKIGFSSGGCSGDTWEVKLIDSEEIMETNPPQRNLRLSLKNEEDCTAIHTKELTFDLSNLQISGNRVQLNIINSEKTILYEY